MARGLWAQWRVCLVLLTCAHGVVAAPLDCGRAITLAPHITELAFAAGAGKQVVGTVTRSDYPPAARDIPRVGDGITVSLEATLVLRPDILLAWRATAATRLLAPALTQAHVPIMYVNPDSLDNIPAQVLRLGDCFGTQATAHAAAQAMTERIKALRQKYAQRTPVSVFIEISEPPLYVVASDPVVNDALKTCGAVNVFADIKQPAAQASQESVLVRQPQVIIAPSLKDTQIAALTRRWAKLGLPAAIEGQVYGVNPDTLFRPGPRIIDATEQLCALIDRAR